MVVATATDAFGNPAAASVTWKVAPAALGTIAPTTGGAATFTAGRLLGTGTITAVSGTFSATASVTVVRGTLRIRSISFAPGRRSLRIVVTAVDGAKRPVSAASVRAVVKLGGKRHALAHGRTGSGGKTMLRAPLGRGCFTVAITRATAAGFSWDGRTPRNRFCRR